VTTRILLVRHGQSTWNADGRWQGRADPPLSELGIRQSEVAAEAVLMAEVRAVWASPLVRAHGTAQRIAEHRSLPVEVDDRLAERDAGEWTGLTRVQIEAEWPGYLAERRRPPGFEDDEALVRRARAALRTIADAHPGTTTLVVSHGGVIRAVERSLGAPDAPPVPNLGGRELGGAGPAVALGERFLLVDPDAVEVTTPHQL
jgi:probable phosphoglycerate mutase